MALYQTAPKSDLSYKWSFYMNSVTSWHLFKKIPSNYRENCLQISAIYDILKANSHNLCAGLPKEKMRKKSV